jgi:ATP-binding cassette subfamily B protein RaxB
VNELAADASVWTRLNLSWRPKLPLLYQTEISECGLACLAMVAGFHGHRTDLRELRKNHSITLKGVTLAQVVSIAQKMHFSTRAIKVELEDLRMIRGPAILHWDMNHFVVLKSATDKHVIIHDPARGYRKLNLSEVSKHFSGIALELSPDCKFEKKKARRLITISSFIKDVVGIKRSLTQIVLLSLVLQFFAVVAPYYNQLVVDNVLVGHDLDFLVVLGVGAIALAITTTAVSLARTWMGIFFDSIYGIQLSSSLLKHMMHLPIGWYESRKVGDILSRFSSLKVIQAQIVSGITGGTLNTLMVLTTSVMMFKYSPLLTLVSLIGVCIYIILRLAFFRPFMQANEEAIVTAAEESSVFLETINSALPIKLYSKETVRHGIWMNRVINTANANLVTHKLGMVFSVLQAAIGTIEGVVTMWIGANLVIANEFTIGMLIAFTAWRGMFVGGLYGLVNGFFSYRMLDLHLDRVADIALEGREQNLVGSAEDGDRAPVTGRLEVRNVSFRFGSQEPWVLRNLSLSVEAGECVTLVAPSGFGKTTLIKVMMGLIEPQEGEVLIDGKGLKQLGLGNYRTSFASVTQNDKLMSGTIEENICFFEDVADKDEIFAAAKMANIHDEIAAMPLGYKSLVGELGSMLSGGQQQRILLARAFFKKPKVLFLDEATSHLDRENERHINEQIAALNITRVQVSHREYEGNPNARIVDLTKLKLQERGSES